MKHCIWILIAWSGIVFFSAINTRITMGHVMPDTSIVVIVFLALRREAWFVSVCAFVLGYLIGRHALAPVGLHECALVICGIGICFAQGSISLSGSFFFASISGATCIVYHALLFVLLYVFRGYVGFSSWAPTLFVFNALATLILAWVLYPVLLYVDKRLMTEQREGLSWR